MESEGNVEVGFVREVGKPVFDMARWLRFLGILMIVMAALGIIAIVIGLILGVMGSWRIGVYELLIIGLPMLLSLLPIILYFWLGNLLYQSGKMAEPAYMRGDKELLIKSLSNLKTYFVVTGILTLIGIVIAILATCLTGLLPIIGITSSSMW